MRIRALLPLFLTAGLFVAACDSGDSLVDTDPPGITVTLLGQIDLTPEGLTHTDVWGYVDPDTGTEYALVGSLGNQPAELYIVDVSTPEAPVLAGTVTVPSFDVKTWRHYAYTVTGGGDRGGEPEGRIIDLIDPANPVVVGTFPSSHNIFIDDGGRMYLEVPGLRIFDLTADPTAPRLLWNDALAAGHDATVVGNRLYDFHGQLGTNLYDVTDPAAPALLGTIAPPSIRYHHSGWPTDDGRFLYLCDELARGASADITVWDVADPANPVLAASLSDTAATVHNLIIADELAYVSHYAAGFRVYDVSDPANPVLAAEFDTAPDVAREGFAGAWGVYPLTPSGRVYVSDRTHGLFIFEVQR